MIKYFFIALVFISSQSIAQGFDKGTIVVTGGIGAPHLFKGIVKIAAGSDAFKNNFGKVLEVSKITGLNPIAIKGEYGISKYFGLGFSVAFWSIKFSVKDYYNLQNQSAGNIIKDSVDSYSFKISSQSFGIRPNLHIPFKGKSSDFYIGMGLGFTKNKLAIGFSSTDAGRLAKSFGKDLELDLSLPGGVYFSPSIGYRHYFADFIGLNFELGYEKGAIITGGLAIRINTKN